MTLIEAAVRLRTLGTDDGDGGVGVEVCGCGYLTFTRGSII